ncbi:MAG: hypothetical protein KDA61_05730, partial [Planctomycetales bacterium]|nr:hypothetical protein [Planctomycetales bacterium]
LERTDLEPTFFVPMTGEAENERGAGDAEPFTPLVNGSFEESDDDQKPRGWYYVRQAQVLRANEADDGRSTLHFRNATPGRPAQALQAIGIDGSRVRTLKLSYAVRTDNVSEGAQHDQMPYVRLTFFDADRRPIARKKFGPWGGTRDWTHQEETIETPSKARLAVLMIGMFGSVGSVEFDSLAIAPRTP